MKKTLLTVIFAALLMSCSSDDDNKVRCDEKIITLGSGQEDGVMQYWIGHGSDSDNVTFTYVTPDQYAWFVENVAPNECWEGIPEEIADL